METKFQTELMKQLMILNENIGRIADSIEIIDTQLVKMNENDSNTPLNIIAKNTEGMDDKMDSIVFQLKQVTNDIS